MKKTSIEVKGAIESREELERAMGEYAAATLALEARKVEMENALREVRDEYEQDLAGLKLAAEVPFKQLELWARRHPEQFEAKRSMDLVHGSIGYRTGMTRVSVKRGADEEALCKALENAGCERVVRTVRQLDREEIIRLAGSDLAAEKLLSERLAAEFGLKVSQTERFFATAREDKSDE